MAEKWAFDTFLTPKNSDKVLILSETGSGHYSLEDLKAFLASKIAILQEIMENSATGQELLEKGDEILSAMAEIRLTKAEIDISEINAANSATGALASENKALASENSAREDKEAVSSMKTDVEGIIGAGGLGGVTVAKNGKVYSVGYQEINNHLCTVYTEESI